MFERQIPPLKGSWSNGIVYFKRVKEHSVQVNSKKTRTYNVDNFVSPAFSLTSMSKIYTFHISDLGKRYMIDI